MVKTVKTSNLCNLSAEEFWGLRMDVGFDLFMANARSGGCEVLELKEQGESVTRTTLLTYQENPIPPSLRGMLGANEFSCKVKARWSRHKFEAGHGMAFTSEPPVFGGGHAVARAGFGHAVPRAPADGRLGQDIRRRRAG